MSRRSPFFGVAMAPGDQSGAPGAAVASAHNIGAGGAPLDVRRDTPEGVAGAIGNHVDWLKSSGSGEGAGVGTESLATATCPEWLLMTAGCRSACGTPATGYPHAGAVCLMSPACEAMALPRHNGVINCKLLLRSRLSTFLGVASPVVLEAYPPVDA